MGTKDTPLSSPVDEQIIREVQASMLTESQGLWFEFLEPPEKHTPPIRTKAFLEFYGFQSEDELPSLPRLLVKPEYVRDVAQARKSALNNPGVPFECLMQVTLHKKNKLKWVHAKVKRFKLSDGREVLASVHTDVTKHQERLRLYEGILNTLPGLVFVKERRDSDKKFAFRFVNNEMKDLLKLNNPADAENKTDADFFDDPHQLEKFLKGDIAADYGERVQGEEVLTLRDGRTLRLATTKIPWNTSLFDEKGETRRCVLGVSIDTTAVTDLLHKMINESADPTYIKDSDHKYVMYNPAFIKKLGLPDGTDITNKTFRDVVNSFFLPGASVASQSQLLDFVKMVEEEDNTVLASATYLKEPHVDKWPEILAGLPGVTKWETRKMRISAGPNSADYILAVDRVISDFRSIAYALLEKLPLGFCLKDENLKIVLCNQHHADWHEEERPIKLEGKDDFYLWTENIYGKERAEKYRAIDKKVLEIGKRYAEHGNIDVFRAALQKYTKYSENEQRKRKDGSIRQSKLEKSKWPEFINGQWHVALAYTDITGALDQVGEYHKFTVHSMKNQFSALESAAFELDQFTKTKDLSHIAEAISDLERGKESFKFFIDHLLKFLGHEIHLSPVVVIDVIDIIAKRVEWTKSVEKRILDIHFFDKVPEESRSMTVTIDREFITAVVMELLSNSATAIRDRLRFMKNEQLRRTEISKENTDSSGEDNTRGEIKVSASIIESNDVFATPRLSLEFSDNGKASIDEGARTKFKRCWDEAEKAVSGNAQPAQTQSQFGLSFLHHIVHRHNGQITLRYEEFTPVVQIFLPLSVAQSK
jgi:PAS domain-containing protein